MRKLDGRRHDRRELALLVGKRIEAFRRERQWTRAVLASRLEVSVRWIESYERGSSLPPVYTLYQLAGAFGVSAGALLDDVPPELPLVDDHLVRTFRLAGALPSADRVALSLFFRTVVMAFGKFKGWTI